jgi:hypothetical protein
MPCCLNLCYGKELLSFQLYIIIIGINGSMAADCKSKNKSKAIPVTGRGDL